MSTRQAPLCAPVSGVKPLPALPAAPRPAGSGCARLCPSSSALPPFPLPPPPPSPPAGRCPRRDGGHRGAGDPALHLLPLPTALPPLLPAGECRRGLRLALPLPLTACPSLLPFPPPHRGGRSPAGAEGGRRRRAGCLGGPSGAVSPPSPPAAPAILGSEPGAPQAHGALPAACAGHRAPALPWHPACLNPSLGG